MNPDIVSNLSFAKSGAKPAAAKGKARANSLIPEPVGFPQSKTQRTTNNSQRTATSVPGVASGSQGPNSTQRGRSQVQAQTEQRINSNLANQSRRPASVPRPSGSESPVTDTFDPLGRNLLSVSNSQAIQNQTLPNPIRFRKRKPMVMDKSKLPTSYGKNSLKFDGDEPDELERYFEILEDVFENAKAATEEEKKWVAVRYCTTATAREWNAFETRQAGSTFEEFKAEVMANYPECRESKEGSLALLDKLVRKRKKNKLAFDDVTEFMSFSRKFRAEAERLFHPTPRISNRELVIRLLGCFDAALVSAVKNKLRITATEALPSRIALAASVKTAANLAASNLPLPAVTNKLAALANWASSREDKYFWTDVLDLATEEVEDGAVSFYETESPHDTGARKSGGKTTVLLNEVGEGKSSSFKKDIEDKIEKLEQTIAHTMDKTQIADKKKWQEMKELLEQMQEAKAPAPAATPKPWGTSSRPTSDGSRTVTNRDCFYCGNFGHFIGDCQKRHKDIDAGLIKVIDGRTTFFDGRPIPAQPRNKCQALKAEEYKERAALNNNLHAQAYDVSEQYTFEAEDIPGYDPKPDEIRTLRAETRQLKVMLQEKMAGSSGPTSTPQIKIEPRPAASVKMEQMAEFLSRHWDENNNQFIVTRNGAGEDSDPEDFQ